MTAPGTTAAFVELHTYVYVAAKVRAHGRAALGQYDGAPTLIPEVRLSVDKRTAADEVAFYLRHIFLP